MAKLKFTPSTPASKAAYGLLKRHLKELRKQAKQAKKRGRSEDEPVHQLRICTRRADAVLRTFEGLIRPKFARRLRRKLGRLRRAAGEKRDLDVLLAGMRRQRGQLPPEERPAGDLLIARFESAIEPAADQLAHTLKQLKKERFWEWWAWKIARLSRKGDSEPTLAQVAKEALPSRLGALYQAHDTVKQGDWSGLHQIRIAGKRLRYAMELFAPLFDDRYRKELVGAVKAMQDLLGSLNDDHTMTIRLKQMVEERTSNDAEALTSLGLLLRRYQASLASGEDRFEAFWRQQMGDRFRSRFGEIVGGLADGAEDEPALS